MIQQYVCKRNGKQIEGGKSEEKKKIEEEEKKGKKNLLMLRCLRPRTQILPSMRGDYFERSAGATSGAAYGASFDTLEVGPSAAALVRPSV